MAQVDSLLIEVLEKRGSDLHFIAGDPPRIRLFGDLSSLKPAKLAPEFVKQALYEILPKTALERFEAKDGADFAYTLADRGRFRVNVMRHLNGMGAVFRAIPSKALTLDELKMPEAVRQMCRANNGLILVTGKTGSGKSTALAAMIDDINRRVKGHILTVEDPIEFVHERKNCLISQREIGVHSPSFSAALHSALREDPDVILIGELRDLETMSIAVTAAEMGILVMGTLHTNGAAATRQAGPRCRPGNPREYAGFSEPDPPGQARPARERHAGRRRIRHAHHGHRDPTAAGFAPGDRQGGVQEGHTQ